MPAGPPFSGAGAILMALFICVLVVAVCAEIAYAVFMGIIVPAAMWLLALSGLGK